MRIAMVSPGLPPQGGGIGTYTDKTARALAARGHDVHVLIPGTTDSVEVVDGVILHSVATPRVRPWVVARTWAVGRALRSLGHVDVVQACEWGGEAWWYSLRPAAPLITRLATPHFLIERLNEVPLRQRLRQVCSRILERSQARRSVRVISPSRVLADEVASQWRINRRDIAVVPTGIRVSNSQPDDCPPELRSIRYVLYFGRLEQRKGVDTWIDALPAVLDADPSLHAVFVGEDMGLQGQTFQDYARGRCPGAMDRLHFLPPVPHARLFPIVARSCLVVMPSRWESLANACLEAMALGRPVVATSGSGFNEVITDGVDGYLVPPGDARSLSQTVVTALADEHALMRVGDGARRRALHYDLDAMVDRLLDVYDDVLVGAAAVPQAMSA
jgi:glycosyltransferase involved in cell wall biosynthesis